MSSERVSSEHLLKLVPICHMSISEYAQRVHTLSTSQVQGNSLQMIVTDSGFKMHYLRRGSWIWIAFSLDVSSRHLRFCCQIRWVSGIGRCLCGETYLSPFHCNKGSYISCLETLHGERVSFWKGTHLLSQNALVLK